MTWKHKSFTAIVLILGVLSVGLAVLLLDYQAPAQFLSLKHLLFFFLLGILLNAISGSLPNFGRRHAMAFLAPLLLLGPPVTILMAVAAGIVHSAYLALRSLVRRLRRSRLPAPVAEPPGPVLPCGQPRRKAPFWAYLREIAQCAVALMCAGEIYLFIGGGIGRVHMPGDLLWVLLAASCMLFVETILEKTAVALEESRPLVAAWRNELRYSLPLEGSFAGLSLLLALLYQQSDNLLPMEHSTLPLGVVFIAFVVLIPCWLLYYSYRLYLEMRQAYSRTLRTLSGLVEARLASPTRECSDPGEKTRWLAECASLIAEQIGLGPEQVEQIRFSAYLLEVGKIGLPRALLARNTFISQRQRRAYARHVELADQILEPVEFLRPVARLIRHQQERYDGLGYPDGLRGSQIPLGSRILTCAEAYVELIKGGENGSALSPEAALQRLNKNRGVRYDPKVLDALNHILRRRGLLCGRTRWQIAPAGVSLSSGSGP